jgi:tetratricopeptide (TPR) repeat protein
MPCKPVLRAARIAPNVALSAFLCCAVLLFGHAAPVLAAPGAPAPVAPPSAVDVATPATAVAEATVERGFGRLVISFKDRNLLPQYVVKSSNGVVVLQFAEPVKIDIDRVPLTLGDYLTIARRDPDGMALRFALARQVKINTMDAGEKLFVDLLPMNWQGPPPALPEAVVQDLAKRADAAIKAERAAENLRFGIKIIPKLDFRVGRQPTFSRFSFGWNVPFDTQMVRENDRVILNFNRVALIDLSDVLGDPPPGLKEINADNVDGKLRIVLTVSPEADVRAFREDQTYVVDLTSGTARPDPLAAAATKPLMAGRGVVPKNAKGRVESPGAMPQPAATVPDAPQLTTRMEPLDQGEASPAPAPMAKPVASAVVAEAPPTPGPSGPAKQPEKPVPAAAAASSSPPQASAQPLAQAQAQAQASAGPMQAGPDAAQPEVIGGGEQRPEVNDPTSDQPKFVRAEAKRVGDMVRIAFPFQDRVASAAFKRDFSLWLVFDTRLPIDTRAIRAALGDLASDVVVGKVDAAQTLRIDLTQPALTTMGADGNSWVLSIGEMVLEPSRPLLLRRSFRTEQQGLLQVDLPGAGAVHDLPDPTIGDHMFVVTAFGPPRGLIKEQSFAELQALGTAHGVAVVPFADDLQVSLEHDVVTIGREKGLLLSPGAGNDRTEAPIPRLDGHQHKVASDAAAFFSKDPDAFNQHLRDLQSAVAESSEKEKTAKRLDLANFYLGHRFAPEALGVLRLISQDEPGIERDPGFLVLFGAAQAMTGRFKEARQILTKPTVADSADAALWRTIADEGLQKWEEGREAAQQAAPAIGSYPPDLQAMFGLSSAAISTELNDFGPAESRLAEIQPEEIDPDLAVRYEILQGRIMDAAGRPDDALTRLDHAVQSTDRRGAAEAEYRRLRILHRDGKITNAETIDRLKSLGFGWRGDELELKTLRFLANLQAGEGQYRDAFNSMRSAIMVDGNSDTTRKLQDEMNKVFLDLYLDGKADTLPPIAALTLYYDFRDMTPIGRQGDEIVRNLADRLIGVDLLDQAAELLNYQVENRLHGAAKAQIAADLAVVDLLNRKPQDALKVLNKTRQSSLPASIERQRRMVEARALSESGRGDIAIELLGQLVGSDVDRLKADIAWKAKNWHDAGERLETMLAGRWNDALELDAQDRQDVLRTAIAYALANDQLALDRLRSKFGAKMSNSPNARAFEVVTAPIQTQGGEFLALAKEIASVDTMRSFLDEYRQQYLTKAPSKPAVGTSPQPPAPAAPGSAQDTSATPKPNDVASADPAKK